MTPFAIEPNKSPIVPFRTSGTGSPLFCFPGTGGNVYIFEELVAALPEGQPVYAIDMEWLCDTKQDYTVEQLAAFCLDVIRKIQKTGPYYFCGYSFGGAVAYEMAMQLLNEGDSASVVALLDATSPTLISNLSGSDSIQFHKTYLIDRIKKYAHHLLRGEIQAFMGRGLAFVTARSGRFIVPAIKAGFRMVNRPLPETMRSNDPGFLKAWNSYVPRRYPRSVICFRVEDRGPEHDLDPSMGWDACVTGGVQVHVVPGGHVDMMGMPSVKVVAETLTTYLDNGRNNKVDLKAEL